MAATHPSDPRVGNLIARGRTADVYAWGDHEILKLFNEGFGADMIDHEARIARAAHASGVPTPPPGDVIDVDGRIGLLYARVSGVSMQQALMRRPWQALGWAKRLVPLRRPADEDRIAIATGALDATDGLRLTRHIHTGDAGDYYRPEGPPPPPARDGPRALDCACLCGGVAFRLPGPAGPVTACHCRQCRRLSGHYAASFDAGEATIDWLRRDTLGEYATPAGGRRGFCTRCGSSLWFRSAAGEFSVEAGAVTGPTGGRMAEHIFVGSKGA